MMLLGIIPFFISFPAPEITFPPFSFGVLPNNHYFCKHETNDERS